MSKDDFYMYKQSLLRDWPNPTASNPRRELTALLQIPNTSFAFETEQQICNLFKLLSDKINGPQKSKASIETKGQLCHSRATVVQQPCNPV